MNLTGYILDESALTGYARNVPDWHSFVWSAGQRLSLLMVPAAAAAAAWARTATEQQRDALQELLDYPGTRVEPLDEAEAAAVGLLLTDAGQPDLLAVGHAVWRARQWSLPVATTQPESLRLVDPEIATITLGA